ncbi:prolipoprotein diacylglyceryl transferase [Helicobacter pametensis]|uniref:prolipoprotein diacylglyceryl transferase n=1 Tax=Helicobacter pametensis TaxID=95149 RepID=UPI0004BA9370|nr:prolipoprotein diacylglyceryl transferase [Helicobacter pametensis]
MLTNWYAHFDPVAFSLFGIQVHWYGIAYVMALLSAFFIASRFKKSPPFDSISDKHLELYFLYAELGIILGARVGYILVYSPNRWEYLLAPWEIFNPFDAHGNFIGISGMSYHGAILGFLLGSYLFARSYKQNLWRYLDLLALSIPLAYVFGRIGNFLNHELYGREIPPSDTFWMQFGVYIDGALRYPSQLIEAFLEGIVVFVIVYIARFFIKFEGGLIAIYGISYALMRFVAEFYRQPDAQLGFYGILSMGQILSILMLLGGLWILFKRYKNTQIS